MGEPKADESELVEVQGEGRGFKGEIIEAEVDRLATGTAPRDCRPLMGFADVAVLRNSDGRLCR